MTGSDTAAGPIRRHLSLPDKGRLVDAVKATQVLANAQCRQQVVDELTGELGPAFDPPLSGTTNSDAFAIVNACIRLGGVHQLVEIFRVLGGETPEWETLRSLTHELLPSRTVEVSRRERLELLLSAGPASAIAHVLADPVIGRHLPLDLDPGTENVEAYRRLEEISGRTGQRARLMYLEFIAHQLDVQAALELHRIIDSMVDDLGGRHAVQGHCTALFEGTGSTELKNPGDPAGQDAHAIDDATPGDNVNGPATAAQQQAETQQVARPPIWGGVPPRNIRFTGREELLDGIHRMLSHHEQTALVSQALHGLGGVGKTQLAVEFAYRYQQHYDLVWFIHADDDRSIRRGLVSLAKRLELPQSEAVEDTVDSVLEVLRRAERHQRMLLVYDNADDPSSLRDYLPSGPGHILITSRNRDWATERSALEIDVFTPQECSELLGARWPELTTEQMTQLADRLGRLPLALEQAAAVHQQTGMQLQEYLHVLDTHPTAVLGEGVPAGYPTSVAVTMRVAYERLRERSPAAAQLLQLCVFLSPHPIAVPMLMRGRGAPLPAPLETVIRDDAGLRMAVRDLGRFALAQIDPGRDLIRIHTLIGAILRDGLEPEQKATNEKNVHALLGLANPRGPDDPNNWRQHAQISPHVIPSGALYSANPDARQVVLDQIRYLLTIGDYPESKRLAQQAVETWKGSLGPDDEMTLLASRHLANTLRALGEYAEARELNRDVLHRMSSTLSADHQYTLATAMNVAADLRLIGSFEQARKLDEENYARYRRVMGDDDLTTWRQAHNLAVDYRLLGSFRRAWELDDRTAHRLDEILGEDHPHTLHSYASLVRDLHGLGQYQRALALQRDKLRVHEQRLAPHHNELMFAKRNLAILWRRTGNYPRALDQAQPNYEICRKTYGPEHEHTLASMSTLSNTLRVIGDLEAALRLGTEALAGYRQSFGEDHPFTHVCAVNVAIVLRGLGRDDQARTMDEAALDGLRRTLGPDHPHTLCAAGNLANDLSRAGLVADSRELSQDTMNRSVRVRGEEHPGTLGCAVNHALDLEASHEWVPARQLRNDAIARMRERLGHEHPETINAERGVRVESDIELSPT